MSRTRLSQLLWKFCCLTLILLLGISGLFTPKAAAILRQHHDAPGISRYHAQASIKDASAHAWQVVLYKVFQPGLKREIHLRLVGFPGIFEFAHPQPLEILTFQAKLLSAADVYTSAPAPNVGEYKFTDVLSALTSTDGLKLYLPLQDGQRLTLQIPKNVVAEWQLLVTDIND